MNIKIEDLSPNYLNGRLSEIAGDRYEQTYATLYNEADDTRRKMNFMWPVDRRKPRDFITIEDFRLSRYALVKNHVSISRMKDTWVAAYTGKKTYKSRSNVYEIALYGCLLKAVDAGETLAPLHPEGWDRILHKDRNSGLDPDLENGEEIKSTELPKVVRRVAIEQSEFMRGGK